MPNPVFPLADLQDSKHFSIIVEDPAIRADADGGFEFTKARHTRTPRRSYTSGFTYLTDAQRVTLEAFWDTVKGKALIFDWINPNTLQTHAVRFTKELEFKYVGIGGNHKWDVAFEVREA